MNSFQQTCPSCHRQLQLPTEAKGQLSVCPACETEFLAAEAIQTSSQSTEPEHTIEYERVTIEAVLTETQTVFSTRQLPFLVPFLLPSVLLLIGFIGPVAYLSDLGTTNQTLALQILVGFSPLLLLPVAYAFWVAMNLANRILDHDPDGRDSSTHHRHWAKPTVRCFAAVYGCVLLSCVLIAGLAIVGAVLVNLAGMIAAPEVRIIAMGLAFAFGIVAFVVTMMRFWPLFPLAMISHTPRDLVRNALKVSGANLMTSFFLVAVVSVILGIGTSFFGLGLPIALPYAAMLVAVAHRMTCRISIPAMESSER